MKRRKKLSDTIQIVGIDVTDCEDFTAVTGMCGKCKTIIDVKIYDPDINQINFPLYINCPACGTKIKRHIIAE
jgi:DNA-directed RNA polymerase subunit RPC12/RpoP